MTPLVLASQSPYRRAQLENFGWKFLAERPLVDEEALKRTGPSDLTELTRFLAKEKALSLAKKYPESLILGSDQLAELEGERLDKPGTVERARAQLRRMSGREHRLITSLAMVLRDQVEMFTDITRIRFKNLNDELIEAYLRIDQPLDCAGSYKIERAGLALVDFIEGQDPSAVQGLPMLSVLRGLERLNIPVTEYWKKD